MSKSEQDPTTTTADQTDSTESSDSEKTPVNYVRIADGTVRQFVIDECVLCGETHRHGSLDGMVAAGGRSHRVEHCNGIDHRGGYFLELADDAEPPARWLEWVDRVTSFDVWERDSE
jgi:hypothetical protein